jgi:hypothetical protein
VRRDLEISDFTSDVKSEIKNTRVEALEAQGLTVATEYHGQGLPKWLLPALSDCNVFMLNAKNVPTDSTLCIIRLSELERLLTAKAKGE